MVERQGGSVTASYTTGNALLYKGGETPLYDGLGSSRTVTDSSASATATATADAFGVAVTSSGTTASAYKFGATSGYRDDGDAGLVKVGCRYYDPQVGRFTTRDTDLSQKAYVYCDGDPVNATDPSGHAPPWGKILIGIGIAGVGYMIYEVVDGIRTGYERRRRLDHGRRNGSSNWNSMRPEDPQHSDPDRHPSNNNWQDDPSLPMPGEPGYHNGQ